MTNTWHRNIQPFDYGQYKDIDLDRLTAYAVQHLVQNKIEPLFENIVVALFKMFPKSFSLVGFDDYPDSNRVNRQLLHCRPKYRNYLVGGMRRGWMPTEKGLAAAEETAELLKSATYSSGDRKKRRTARERTKSIHFVNEILRSEAYKKFQKEELEQISDLELCDVLHSNLDTPPSILVKSIQRLVSYAEIAGNVEVVRFLAFARQRLVKI